MIDTLILIGAGGIIAILAIFVYIGIQRNNHLQRKKTALKGQNDMLFKENAELTNALDEVRRQYNKLQQENVALNARNTALVEAMEARPTQPKRTVRKNATQATEQ